MAKVFYYNNTKTPDSIIGPQIEPDFHKTRPLGFAYETETHFVHFYAGNSRLWYISYGFAVVQMKNGVLSDWIARNFGGTPIGNTTLSAGTSVKAVWRPGLYHETQHQQALAYTARDRRLAEQNLRIIS